MNTVDSERERECGVRRQTTSAAVLFCGPDEGCPRHASGYTLSQNEISAQNAPHSPNVPPENAVPDSDSFLSTCV